MIITAITNGTLKIPIKDTPQKRLFVREFFLALREEWFSSLEFSVGILILDKKYKHPRSKSKKNFYSFNDQLDYGIAHYFAKLEMTKDNVNMFLIDPLIILFSEELSYKNADK